jgi:hypothetical protein
VPLAAESGCEYRLRIGCRLGQQPREQQRRPIQRRVLRGARKHVDERRRRRDGGGGWDGRRVVLERLERGGLRGAVTQALGHGARGELHLRGRGGAARQASGSGALPLRPQVAACQH